ncbi:hypothetical protein CFP56_028901 [Quercus suber]|uniref:F-box associated beta-propeller type 3 domain-containing protein n=1 Tax=Quercus suber TaxID=58331 RepID=A0AAW0JUJ5_QUESU
MLLLTSLLDLPIILKTMTSRFSKLRFIQLSFTIKGRCLRRRFTHLWRRVEFSVESVPNFGSIYEIQHEPFLFCNGALHSMAYTRRKNNTNNFILSFDINDEIFREIRLPENNLDDGVIPIGYSQDFRLAVFKGSLALIASDIGQVEDFQVTYKCVIWVMRRYGVVVVVVESWTKKTVAVKPGGPGQKFLGCTDSGQLLFFHISGRIVSYDPESGSQNEGNIGIPHPYWMGYTTDFMESLVLLDHKKKSHLNLKIS